MAVDMDYLNEWNPQASDLLTLIEMFVIWRRDAIEVEEERRLRESLLSAVAEALERGMACERAALHLQMGELQVCNGVTPKRYYPNTLQSSKRLSADFA